MIDIDYSEILKVSLSPYSLPLRSENLIHEESRNFNVRIDSGKAARVQLWKKWGISYKPGAKKMTYLSSDENRIIEG